MGREKTSVSGILPEEFKRTYTDPTKSPLSGESEQPFKQKPRKQTTDEEKLKKLYNKVEKSVLTGQSSLMKYISDAKSFGLDVKQYEETLGKIRRWRSILAATRIGRR